MIKCYVDQVGMPRPGSKDRSIFNQIKFTADTYEEALDTLKEDYRIKPPTRIRGVFIDTKEGTKQIGFMHHRWNKDWSHHGKSWWEENWVTFVETHKKQPKLPKQLQSHEA